MIALFAELLAQPLNSRSFFVSAAYEDTTRLIAYSIGCLYAILGCGSLWLVKDAERNKGMFASRWKFAELALIGVGLFVIGFVLGRFIEARAVPLVGHHFAPKTEVEAPFTITGFAYGRVCRGLYAVNRAFIDDRICGVQRWGHADEWRGRTIFVIGLQSDYGLTMETYRIEPLVPPPND